MTPQEPLVYKPDMEEAKQRMLAWWRFEKMDRPVITLNAPRPEPLEDLAEPVVPEDLETKWTSLAYRLQASRYGAARTYFGGESLPLFMPTSGAGSLAAYMGCPQTFAETTIWFEPCVEQLSGTDPPRFDPEDVYYRNDLDAIRAAAKTFGSGMVVIPPDLVENIDVLASIRGTQPLLFDLIECPDDVHRFQEVILEDFFAAYDPMYEAARQTNGGGGFCFGIWGPGKTVKVQCDFCAMISPAMFDEFVVPYLSRQCAKLDYTLYHLDGPDAVCHADSLIAMEELTAINWVTGAGNPDCGDPVWFDMYKEMLDGGKPIHIAVTADGAKRVIKTFGPDGLFLRVHDESITTPADCDRFLLDATTWSRR